MKVGILSQFFGHGGIGGHLRRLAENLMREGQNPFVFTLDGIMQDQAPDYVFPLQTRLKLGWRLLSNFQLSYQVKRAELGRNLDLLHSNPSASFGTHLSKRLGIPQVATVYGSVRCIRMMLAKHTELNELRGLSSVYAGSISKALNAQTEVWMEEYDYQHSDAVIAVSPSVRDFYRSIYGTQNRVHVIPPFVGHASPGTNATLRKVVQDYSEDRVYFLFVGPPTVEKGFHYVLEALPHLARQLPNFRVLLAGPGYDYRIQNLLHKKGLSRFLQILGWLSPERLASVMNIPGALIVPSLAEGHPVSVAEAMFQSLPAVGFETMGVRDVIQHRKTGVLVPTADIPSLVFELTQLAGNEEERTALGLAALKEAESRYDPRRLVTETIDVYKTALDEQT